MPGSSAPRAAIGVDDVKILPVGDRRGQVLHNALLDRMNPHGEPGSPRYTLTLRLDELVRAVDTRRDSTVTRNDIVLVARYDLRDAESDVIVFRQRSEAVSSYNLATQRFASVVSEDDARRRAAQLLADEIALTVALYIRRRHAAAAAGGAGARNREARPARRYRGLPESARGAGAVVLFHGGDAGLVRERAERVAKTVVPALDDPFRVARFRGQDIAEDPARLGDEAAAIAMGGGRRVVRIVEAGDRIAKTVARFLAEPMGDALIVIEAETLASSSTLRKAVEAADNGVAIPCYPDEADTLERIVDQTLASFGLAADGDARAYLVDRLGGDRLVTRRELEKLALYAGEAGRGRERPITLAEAAASVGDTAGITYDDLCAAVAAGDRDWADRCAVRLQQEGEAAVTLLRIVSRHMQRFHQYHAALAQGRPAMEVTRGLRLFGPRASAFTAAARVWRGALLSDAFRRLNEAEQLCKSTGYPDFLIAARALAALTGLARNATARR